MKRFLFFVPSSIYFTRAHKHTKFVIAIHNHNEWMNEMDTQLASSFACLFHRKIKSWFWLISTIIASIGSQTATKFANFLPCFAFRCFVCRLAITAHTAHTPNPRASFSVRSVFAKENGFGRSVCTDQNRSRECNVFCIYTAAIVDQIIISWIISLLTLCQKWFLLHFSFIVRMRSLARSLFLCLCRTIGHATCGVPLYLSLGGRFYSCANVLCSACDSNETKR